MGECLKFETIFESNHRANLTLELMHREFSTSFRVLLIVLLKIPKIRRLRSLLLKVNSIILMESIVQLRFYHISVGVFHAKKKVTKKAYNELRVVLVEILSDVCKLDDNGKTAITRIRLDVLFLIQFNRQDCLVEVT